MHQMPHGMHRHRCCRIRDIEGAFYPQQRVAMAVEQHRRIGDKAAEPPYQKIQSSVDSIFSSPASSIERILIIGPSTISICAMF
jgi:hypothetical protein